jgi:phosphatidylglycerophosphatase A
MKLNPVDKFLGSGFYTGYIPFASGTFGSLAALILYYLVPGSERTEILLPSIIAVIIYGIYVSNKFDKVYGKDPAECTIDEVAGMWISLLFLPKQIYILIIAFFVWRIMDIIKPFPARKLEDLKGGWGIMMDDIVASIYALGVVHLAVYLIN